MALGSCLSEGEIGMSTDLSVVVYRIIVFKWPVYVIAEVMVGLGM